MSTTFGVHEYSDMVNPHLPSWGDPILPQTWHHSEEEIMTRFPWLKHNDEAEKDDEYFPMVVLDPLMDTEMVSLLKSAIDAEECASLEYHVDDSLVMSRDDDSVDERGYEVDSRHTLEEDDPSLESGLDSSNWSSLSSDTEDMDCRIENEAASRMSTSSPHRMFEWSVEECKKQNFVFFKLRPHRGAYMELRGDEIIDSLKAILEDSEDTVTFRVQQMDGIEMFVDYSLIIPVISCLVSRHLHVGTSMFAKRERTKETNGNAMNLDRKTFTSKTFRWSMFSRHKLKDRVAQKRPRRTSPAWKSLSGRTKTRLRRRVM